MTFRSYHVLGCACVLSHMVSFSRGMKPFVRSESGPIRSTISQGRMAIAVLAYTNVSKNSAFRDDVAVFAYAAKAALHRSAYATDLLAFVPDSFSQQELAEFEALGLTPRPYPQPVPLDQVQNSFGRAKLAEGCCGVNENLKYYGLTLTEYSRVLVLDSDVLLLEPPDVVYGKAASLVGTYDYELEFDLSAYPPVQGGYLLFTPNRSDFDAIVALTREGDFREGLGWKGSETGWTYGGAGPDGLLSFYFNQVHPGHPEQPFDTRKLVERGNDLPDSYSKQPPGTRFSPLDRSVHDVIDTTDLQEAYMMGNVNISHIQSFHFTGKCEKPWKCIDTEMSEICRAMTDRWWALRSELARAHGLADPARCNKGAPYAPIVWK